MTGLSRLAHAQLKPNQATGLGASSIDLEPSVSQSTSYTGLPSQAMLLCHAEAKSEPLAKSLGRASQHHGLLVPQEQTTDWADLHPNRTQAHMTVLTESNQQSDLG